MNYDCPASAEAYVHRIGRSGRAGAKGRAITFVTEADSVAVADLIEVQPCDPGAAESRPDSSLRAGETGRTCRPSK